MALLGFTIALALACVAGLQIFYMMFLETRSRQQARRIAELERDNAQLATALKHTQAALEEVVPIDAEEAEEESWPELLDDKPGR